MCCCCLQNVKRRSQHNPLSKRRHKSANSNSDDESYDTDDMGTDNDENDAQPPVISNEGYYWIGKDYVNTYKGESKDIADFSTGTHHFIFYKYNSL